jgi:GTP-sensing pleiotropic transcriptional regulator CodY
VKNKKHKAKNPKVPVKLGSLIAMKVQIKNKLAIKIMTAYPISGKAQQIGSLFILTIKVQQMGTLKWPAKVQQIGTPIG